VAANERSAVATHSQARRWVWTILPAKREILHWNTPCPPCSPKPRDHSTASSARKPARPPSLPSFHAVASDPPHVKNRTGAAQAACCHPKELHNPLPAGARERVRLTPASFLCGLTIGRGVWAYEIGKHHDPSIVHVQLQTILPFRPHTSATIASTASKAPSSVVPAAST
jgi:hypothetical protein